MEIEFTGEHADELAGDFYSWLRNEALPGVLLERKLASPKLGAMGPEWLPIVVAVLASPLVVKVVESFEAWLISRKPKIKVTWRAEDGTVFEMETADFDKVNKLRKTIPQKLFPTQAHEA